MMPARRATVLAISAVASLSTLDGRLASGQPLEVTFVRSIGGSFRDGHFKNPRGIATDHEGRLFVVDSGYCRIQVFDGNGAFLAKWGSVGTEPGQFRGPWGIAIDRAGLVYVTDAGNSRVQVFTRNGRFVRAWGSPGTAPGQFRQPKGIAVDREGNVLVADAHNLRVQVFTNGGRFLRAWGSKGNGDGQFLQPSWPDDGDGPVGIAVSASGEVFVTDHWNHRVQVFASDGVFLRKWGQPAALNTPSGVALDAAGHVYVVSSGGMVTRNAFSVQKFSEAGEFRRRWGGDGDAPGKFDAPVGIAFDTTGNFYVADSGNHRIQKFSAQGVFVRQWGSSGDGLLKGPIDVALDRSGNLYVVEGLGKRVQKFASDGTFLKKWTSSARAPRLVHPVSIAVDDDSRVYVADLVDNRIQAFTADGEFIRSWGGLGDGGERLDTPGALAIDPAGHVYVLESHRLHKFTTEGVRTNSWQRPRRIFANDVAVDRAGNVYVSEADGDRRWSRIRIIAPTGEEVATWRSLGDGDRKFDERTWVAVAPDGLVYVVAWWKCRIEVFSPTGAPLGGWGTCGFGDGQFGNASGIAVDATGHVVVADYTNNRVHVFRVRTRAR
jgi:DNA-binding beta-propeller fold protein YncE